MKAYTRALRAPAALACALSVAFAEVQPSLG
jgi:hypothetical protein